jgi:N-acetylneuraminic acid mutarotase
MTARLKIAQAAAGLVLTAALMPAQNWTVRASVPQHVYGHAGAALNGKIHLLGGCPTSNWQNTSKLHQVYDPARDEWTNRAQLPEPTAWAMPAIWNGKLYLFGGSYNKPGQGITSSDGAWVYDPARDRWSKLRNLPEVRMNGFATSAGDYIYISMGYNRQGPATKGVVEEYKSTYRYDPKKDTYTRVADAPINGCYIASGAHNGKVYAVPGAYDEYGFHGEYTWADGAAMYDPAADRWTRIDAPRVKKRVFFLTQCSASAVDNGKLWVVGGMGENRQRTEVTEYLDLEKLVFVRGPDIDYGRCCGGCGIADGTLVIAGGFFGIADTSKPALPTWVLETRKK